MVLEDHDLVQAGLKARELIGLTMSRLASGRSAPMVFIKGKAKFFDRLWAWRRGDFATVMDSVRLDDVVKDRVCIIPSLIP